MSSSGNDWDAISVRGDEELVHHAIEDALYLKVKRQATDIAIAWRREGGTDLAELQARIAKMRRGDDAS